MGIYSPIRYVAPILANGSTGTHVTDLKDPSVYKYLLADISAPNAGRTEDMTMHKMRIGQAVSIDLQWNGVYTEMGSSILKAYNSQYVEIEYLDLLEGTYKTAVFYVKDRTAPMYNSVKGLWENISFGITQRIPDKITT